MEGCQWLFKGHYVSLKRAAGSGTSYFPDSVNNAWQIQLRPQDLKPGSPGAAEEDTHGLILNKFQGTKLCCIELDKNCRSMIIERLEDRNIKHPEDRETDSKAPASQQMSLT